MYGRIDFSHLTPRMRPSSIVAAERVARWRRLRPMILGAVVGLVVVVVALVVVVLLLT